MQQDGRGSGGSSTSGAWPVLTASMPPSSSSSRSVSPSPIRPPIRRPCARRGTTCEVRGERLACRPFDSLACPDDVPAERLIRVQEPVVDISDVALRRVEVHVISEDHALLLRDLRLVEARVEEHVGEDVEREVACLRPAADVVAGELLAREGVELPADRVDLVEIVRAVGRRCVPLKNMCSAKCAMPFDSGVS